MSNHPQFPSSSAWNSSNAVAIARMADGRMPRATWPLSFPVQDLPVSWHLTRPKEIVGFKKWFQDPSQSHQTYHSPNIQDPQVTRRVSTNAPRGWWPLMLASRPAEPVEPGPGLGASFRSRQWCWCPSKANPIVMIWGIYIERETYSIIYIYMCVCEHVCV